MANHEGLGGVIAGVIKDAVYGRRPSTAAGVISDRGDHVVSVSGQRRFKLEQLLLSHGTLAVTTHAGTRYTIKLINQQPTRTMSYWGDEILLYLADVVVRPIEGRRQLHRDILVGYYLPTGQVVLSDHAGELIRTSSTVRGYEVF